MDQMLVRRLQTLVDDVSMWRDKSQNDILSPYQKDREHAESEHRIARAALSQIEMILHNYYGPVERS